MIELSQVYFPNEIYLGEEKGDAVFIPKLLVKKKILVCIHTY